MATTVPNPSTTSSSQRLAWLRPNYNWLFLIPTLFFFLGWQIYPIFRVLWLSFTNAEYLSSEPTQFVGFDNFARALADPQMWDGLWRAGQFTLMFLPGTIIVPLFLAILVDRVQHQKLATFYRLVLLIPAVIPSTLIFVLWKWMYNFQIGPINYFLVEVLGIFTARTAPQWLGGTPLTLPSIAIFEVWWGLGYHSMFFLAGLASIPKSLNEAAR
ncbi:MAG: sugar ABC transporter permease, partial [Chloroflexota bacterium]